MRVFNVRLAAILLAIVVVFGVGIFLVHGYQVRRNAVFFLTAAEEAQERVAKADKDKDPAAKEEATKDAIEYLVWYIRLMPSDYKAMEKYALLLAETAYKDGAVQSNRAFLQAVSTLQNTVRLAPERSDARRQLVKMLMQMRRYQDAKQHLQEFLLNESPKDAELLEQLGVCQTETGKFKEAQETFKKAITLNKKQLTAYDQLARLLRFHLQQPEQADEWMEKLVTVNPKEYKAHLLRGYYLAHPLVNRSSDAIDEASEAIKLAPEDMEVLAFTAVRYAATADYDKARDCINRAIKLYPTAPHLYDILSDIELRDKKPEKAIAALRQGIKATKENPQLLWKLGSILVEAKKLDETQQIIDDLRKTNFPKPQLDLLAARLEFARGKWRPALRQFEYVRGAMVSNPAAVKQVDFWISQCYEQLGNSGQQEQALRRTLAIDPSFAPARAALAKILARKGQIGPALDLAPVEKDSAAALIQTARVVFYSTLRKPAAERNWQAVEKAIVAAEKAAPDSTDLAMMRVDWLLAQDRIADAEKALLKLREKTPKNIAVWNALVGMADNQKDQKKAEKLLEESRKELGDSAAQRLLQVQYLLRHRDKDTVQRLHKLGENSDGFPEAERLQLWAGLLQAALQVNDGERADAIAKQIAEKQPNNVQVRYWILERAIASEDQAAIEKAIADVRRVAGEGAYSSYGQAMLLYLQSRKSDDATTMLKQALDYLAKAREFRGDWSRVPLAEALIHERLGKPDLALRSYREAVNLGERNVNLIQRIVRIYFQSRQFSEADELLNQIEKEQKQLPPELLKAITEIALQQGELDRAIQKARLAVSPDSKDFKDQLWLGQMLGIIAMQAKAQGTQGTIDERQINTLLADAEQALQRAAKIEPKQPVVWVSLVRFLAMIGEDDKAEAVVRDAEKKLPEKNAGLTLAQCYEIIKKNDEARKKYEAALKAAPKDVAVVRAVADFYRRTGKAALAETELQKILDENVLAKEADIIWARRQLARILITRRDYKSHQKALGLIEKNLAGRDVSPEDRRMYGKLKASDPAQGQRANAIAILTGLIEDKSATPDDILELAKMYIADDNWTEASKLLRGLVTANDREPRYVAIYVEELLKHNEISSVEMYCDRLEKLAPNWFPTISLRADLLCANNEPQQAFELLKSFIDKTDALPRDRATRLRLVAERIERLGSRLSKSADQAELGSQCSTYAESLYRTYAKENPGRDLVLAVYLGTRGKVDEALDILDKSLEASAEQDFVQACSLILEAGKANKEQSQRMDQILQRAMTRFKQATPLQLVIAELRTYQTEYAQAADIYRQVLKKAPDSVVALNNLAVLQALQGINLDESLKLVDRAVEVAGPLGSILDSRGTVYMAMNNPAKALEDLKDAVADQDAPARLFHLAQAHALAGDKKTARTVLDKALDKGLTKESLQPLEVPAFEKLLKLPR